jgi:hypothetical protein
LGWTLWLRVASPPTSLVIARPVVKKEDPVMAGRYEVLEVLRNSCCRFLFSSSGLMILYSGIIRGIVLCECGEFPGQRIRIITVSM